MGFTIENGVLKDYIEETGVTEVVIPDGVTSIGDLAFYNCTSLTSVIIPDSVTSIGWHAFEGCTSLTTVTIPDSVTSIDEGAFAWCDSLISVTIPDSVTSIGRGAFKGCTNLASVTIPDSVTSIGGSAFIDTLLYSNDRRQYVIYGKVLYDYNGSSPIIIIPDGVTSICDEAFKDCTNITTVTIPNSVTSIGNYAFSGCNSLTSVTIPDSVTSISNYAFIGCTSLTTVTIPDSMTSIGDSAFKGCSSLTSVTIPGSVTSIGDSAFEECSSLTSVTFPDSVTSIGWGAFENCTSLTSVTIPDSVTSIDSHALSQCISLTSVTIPDSVTSIGDYAFYYCKSLTSIIFVGNIPEFKKDAFEGCPVSSVILKKAPIKDWKEKGNLRKVNAAVGFMVAYADGYEYDEEILNANRKWVKTNKTKLFDLCIGEPRAIKYLSDEKLISYEEAQDLVSKAGDNVEIKTMLLEYINNNFNAEEIIQAESDKMDKAFGLKDYTLAEYKKMYGLKDDGSGGYIITKYDHDEVYITIPEKINGKTVTAIGGFAFSPDQQKLTPKQREQRRQIVSVMLPDSVIAIGEYAFKHCEKLEDITTSATNVGKGAFLKCTGKVTRKLKEKYPDAFEGDTLVGMTFVITGALKKYTRDQAKAEIEARGGKLSGSASANACYIVTNHPKRMTEKLMKAKEEGVPVISEVEFLKMLK